MKPISIPLMTLLRFLSNQFEPDEQREIESELRSDPIAFARLQELRNVANTRTSRVHEKSVDSIIGNSRDESSQRIAAFLDQGLNAEETDSFENECWNSPALLHDVFVLYQSGLRSQPSPMVEMDRLSSPAQQQLLRQRLVALFPAEPLESQRQKIRDAVPVPVAIRLPNRSTDLDAKPDAEIPIVVTPRSSVQNHQTQMSRATGVLISVAAMVAVVTIAIGVITWSSSNSTPTVDLRPPDNSNLPNTPDQLPIESPVGNGLADGSQASQSDKRIVASENPDDLDSEKLHPTRDVIRPDLPRDGEKNGLVDNNNSRTMRTPETVEKKPGDRVRIPDIPTTVPARLPWSWSRVEGLVAVRTSGSKIWSGALAEDVFEVAPEISAETESIRANGWDCKVLPYSWAQANLNGMGVWTIAENTDLSIASYSVQKSDNDGSESNSSNVDALRIQINLRRGRIAISDAKINSSISIKTETGTWAIRITSDSTVVIVEQDANSQVWVQDGSANINGTELNARQQLTRKRDGRLEEQTVNRQSVKWLRKPENKFPDQRFSDQWLASRDLFADLSQAEAVSAENQSLLRAAFATIDPPGQAVKYLANVMPDVRAEGIQWLVAYGHDERRMRHLCIEMATELGAPGLRATLPRLVIAINRKRLPPIADVEALIAGLQHQNPSVRRLSYGFLVHLFGAVVDYDSESNAASRNAQARKWLAAVHRLYRRVDSARQR